ncbi:hypothetical protein Glove_99g353 [Diversispora epigaea]|uniref:Uncharacterized protein n=1 Tax=Diversispora epigaea TaxID=1348612 RepID=A0A397J468_9GLOM|nr:hypothetical protein Glove_99g353 [Diversispora epigaea]
MMSSYEGTPQMKIHSDNEVLTRNDWKYGLFNWCDDCGLCLNTYCCPCVTYAQNKEKLEPGSTFIGNCMLWYFASLSVGPWIGFITRREIRNRKNIEGNTIKDWFIHCCCSQCALVQEARELS